MREHESERGRGLGPFTGRQLTTIVCVAIVAMVMIPTAAIAAGASFTSNSNGTPAVRGINTASNGIGVVGKGNHYGVFSNGPLGVATGKRVSCGGCVGTGALANSSVSSSKIAAGAVGASALSASAKVLQPLGSGESESGWVADGGGSSTSGILLGAFTLPRPVAAYASITIATGTGDPAHCTGAGSAARGYLCIYDFNKLNATLLSYALFNSTGGVVDWTITGTNSYGEVNYTITAP